MIGASQEIVKDSTGAEFVITKYLGEVVDIKDPLKEGRCKVKVFSVFDNLPTADIPWAIPMKKAAFFGQDAKAGSLSIPKKGSIVEVIFNNGNLYSPEYGQIQEIGDDIKEELQKSSDFEYEGAHYILFDGDEEIKMWFNKNRGLTFQLKDSYLNIKQNSNIEIFHKDGLSAMEFAGNVIRLTSQSQVVVNSPYILAEGDTVHVKGNLTRLGVGAPEGVEQHAVMGETLHATLLYLAGMIDAKLPSTPGACAAYVTNALPSLLSQSVTVTK
jgi:hypothetical protein